MIITFHSPVTADVIMFGDIALQLIQLMGKDTPGREGIFTVEQLPDAIARLRAAMEKERERLKGTDKPDDEPAGPEQIVVNLIQRAAPLLDVLEKAVHKQRPVTWEAN